MSIAIGTIAIILGLCLIGYGVLSYFGGMMSDAPAEGDVAGKSGCIALVVGLALVALGVWMILWA